MIKITRPLHVEELFVSDQDLSFLSLLIIIELENIG